jgi:hypothetical protein
MRQFCRRPSISSTIAGFQRDMKKHLIIYGLIYGLCGGLLILALRLVEYRFLVLEHSVEIYGGLIALVFASLGIWLGLKLTRKKEIIVERERIIEREVPVFTAAVVSRGGYRSILSMRPSSNQICSANN